MVSNSKIVGKYLIAKSLGGIKSLSSKSEGTVDANTLIYGRKNFSYKQLLINISKKEQLYAASNFDIQTSIRSF
jgi:hypothetical protein